MGLGRGAVPLVGRSLTHSGWCVVCLSGRSPLVLGLGALQQQGQGQAKITFLSERSLESSGYAGVVYKIQGLSQKLFTTQLFHRMTFFQSLIHNTDQ